MSNQRLGIWFIGARGGIATTAMTGLFALQKGLTRDTGLVSELSPFAHLDLPMWDQFVVGGHEIRAVSLVAEVERLHRESRVLDAELLAACREDLERTEQNIRPGTLWNVGETIRQLAADAPYQDPIARRDRSGQHVVERLKTDLQAFRQEHALADVVVVNVASTEASGPSSDEQKETTAEGTIGPWPATWREMEPLVNRPDCPLPASSLYAIAALDLGMPYINFTPSLGSEPRGLDDLARLRNTCYAGRDGKTGETLLKSVLAPMFVSRHLEVLSWVGHNIFGNLDGKVLDNPVNKAAKLRSKDRLLGKMFGYAPETLVSIEHIASLGDWKTAWDHIHFKGFLDTPMTMQLTWQGCDSLLAAPLVLDLVRFALAARGRGETGPLTFLSSFFKSPVGVDEHAFSKQYDWLLDWAQKTTAPGVSDIA
jgi:myo-inositol-1-phosphate synthase